MMRLARGAIYVLRPFERGIRERLGQYRRFVMPGIGFQIPFLHVIRIRDIREHTMDIDPQAVITKDNVEVRVDGIMWVRPEPSEEAIKTTFYSIDDWKHAITQLAMTNLRQEFGNLTLDESLVAREQIAANLQTSLNEYATDWGLRVTRVEIRLIDPPADIKQAMHKQKAAEQERRAMRLLATGEFEASEQIKKAVIQKAEGKRAAEIQVAEGKAKAIELVNEAAQKYFVGNAQLLRQIEMTEVALRDNAKIVLTEKGIRPNIILGKLMEEPPAAGDEQEDRSVR